LIAITGVGTCTVTASAPSGPGPNNTTYSADSVTQSFKISPAVLTVAAGNLAVPYGQPIPSLTTDYTITGYVNSQTSAVLNGTAPSLSTTATSTSAPGPYPITVSTGTLAAANYSFLYVPGTLTIQQGTATISISNIPSNAVYSGSFTPTYLYSGTGTPTESTTSSTTSVCTVSGSTVNFINLGTCTLTAHATATASTAAATGNPQSFTVTGPSLTVSPSSINFGTVVQGSITTKSVTLTNVGTAPVTINQPLISIVKGGNSNEFVSVNLCPSSLAVGKSCIITISFVAGPYYTPQSAILQIMDNAPGSPQQVTLSALVLIPQTITFTTNPPSSAAYRSSFTVAATGGASGNPVTFTSSGVCSITATAPGTATYTMNSSTGTCSVIANQAGNATYAAAAQVTRAVTATLPAQTITFTTNPPATAAWKTSFTVAATASSGLAVTFTSSGSCSNSGATYTMTSATGTCSVIASQAGNSSYAPAPQVTKSVSATWSQVSFNPTSLSFGTIKHTTTSTLNVTLSNSGSTLLVFSGFSIAGTNATHFTQTNNCGSSLAAGAHCTIAVKFTPSTTGTFSAALQVVDNAQPGSGTQTIPLSGSGN
jgi:hypothetical protein